MALIANGKILLRAILVALTAFALLAALYGHFLSDWTQRDKYKNDPDTKFGRFSPSLLNMFEECGYKKCPDIRMERFCLVMLFLSLFGTIGSMMLERFNANDNKWLKVVDLMLHVVLGVLLFFGMILFLVSAIQVKGYFDYRNGPIREENEERKKKDSRFPDEIKEYDGDRQWEIKIFAVVLGFAAVALHGIIVCFIGIPLFQRGVGGKVAMLQLQGAASPYSVQVSPSKQGAEVTSETETG